MGSATVVEPLTTRETVARETPARRATASSVGRSRAAVMSALQAVTPDHLPIPARAVLGDPALGQVVDVDDPKSLAVALGPLEVVQQRPYEISAKVNPARDRGA